MRITIERELKPGVFKTSVVDVRNVGKSQCVILASRPGSPEIPGTLVATDRARGSSFDIALHALRAVAGEIRGERTDVARVDEDD